MNQKRGDGKATTVCIEEIKSTKRQIHEDEKKKEVIDEGVTGFSLKVKRLGRTGGEKRGKKTKSPLFFCLSFFQKRRRGGREGGRESWREVYDGAFSFFLKCNQLYMMAMAPEEEEDPRPWLQAIFISSITTPLDFVVTSPIIRNILLSIFIKCDDLSIGMINKS